MRLKWWAPAADSDPAEGVERSPYGGGRGGWAPGASPAESPLPGDNDPPPDTPNRPGWTGSAKMMPTVSRPRRITMGQLCLYRPPTPGEVVGG